MKDCLFCKILKGEIPSKKVYEDENVYAFKDLHPLAPVHVLFVHKKHTSDASHLVKDDPSQLVDLFSAIALYAQKPDSALKNGHRIVTNVGPDAGQTIFHTHFHVVGGAPLAGFGV